MPGMTSIRRTKEIFPVLAAGLLSGLLSGSALAQGTERLGDFGNWSAFRFFEGGNVAPQFRDAAGQLLEFVPGRDVHAFQHAGQAFFERVLHVHEIVHGFFREPLNPVCKLVQVISRSSTS